MSCNVLVLLNVCLWIVCFIFRLPSVRALSSPVQIYVPSAISCQQDQVCDIRNVRLILNDFPTPLAGDIKLAFELSVGAGKLFLPRKRGLMLTQGNPLLAESLVAGKGGAESVQQALSHIQYFSGSNSANGSTVANLTDTLRVYVRPVISSQLSPPTT